MAAGSAAGSAAAGCVCLFCGFDDERQRVQRAGRQTSNKSKMKPQHIICGVGDQPSPVCDRRSMWSNTTTAAARALRSTRSLSLSLSHLGGGLGGGDGGGGEGGASGLCVLGCLCLVG